MGSALDTGTRPLVGAPLAETRANKPRVCDYLLGRTWPSQVKVYSSRRQKSHMQRQWARLARRGWCAGIVPTAPRSLERIRREMRQAEPPGASFSGLISGVRVLSPALSGGGNPISIDQRPKPRKEG